MPEHMDPLEEEILLLYREPAIGASYCNTYGEENIKNLVGKYQGLDEAGMSRMREMVVDFSQSMDLTSSFVSVGVLHALGLTREVEAAYAVAGTRQDAQSYIHHFDIGKSLADHFFLKP